MNAERAEPFWTSLWDSGKVVWGLLSWRQRWRVVAVVSLVSLGSAFHAVAPLALGHTVDDLTAADLTGATVAVLAYAALLSLGRASWHGMYYLYGGVMRFVERTLAQQTYAHVLDLPHAFHLGRRTGELNRTVSDGLLGWRRMLDAMVHSVLPFVVEVGATLAVLLTVDIPTNILLVLVAFMAAYGFVFYWGLAEQRQRHLAASTGDAEAMGVATDALLNHETVKLFGRSTRIIRQLEDSLERGSSAWRGYYRIHSSVGVLLALIFGAALGAALFLAARETAAGRLSPGGFVLVNAYVLQVIGPVERLGHMAREFTQALDLTRRLRRLMGEPTETALSSGTRALPAGGPVDVRMEGLTFGYDPRRPVLRGIDLHLPAGRTLAVVGRSGSGKSTLARMLFRLYQPTGGRLLIDGLPIEEIALASLRDAIAVVPQDTVLFHDTLASNVAFGRPEATPDEVAEAARIAGLDRVVAALPDGWNTIVGERGLRLSGGEKQRVAIARAVLKHPRLFILDEATSSLDTRTEQMIQESLTRASHGVTTLIIAHRLSTVRDADEIVVLDEGRVIERGSHDLLLAKGGSYAALWRAQQEEADRQERADEAQAISLG
ncbi:MAG TPA: ATP-binding cassette domain-containing protein [Geminicoccus sp.]|uniref:ATP-binding cassette domain-containing protein n=1 Tax=Geminicoccus sp. TaxID=2024832 RepID=UPI002E30E967|nr:ATP-binding cassette domain-containing protein [Geminicoccus sp.]HEX2529765.1 ATP-binding cassette domain-containing protein [Geminicoccus sp.]